MAITIQTNKTQSAFVTGTPTANFKENVLPLKFASRFIKIAVTGGTIQFSFNKKDVDGEVQTGETINFDGMQTSELSFKATSGTPVMRVWVYK